MARDQGEASDLRASDAERDAVATELAQHFQDGRLDQAELDERLGAALVAKTRRDLDALLTDLPEASTRQVAWAASEPDRVDVPDAGLSRPSTAALTKVRLRGLVVLPLLAAAIVIVGLRGGGWQHGWPFAPFGLLWLIVPILVARRWIRGGRRQQWR
jgi:hypothetical protein